jgi:hypothetical protein
VRNCRLVRNADFSEESEGLFRWSTRADEVREGVRDAQRLCLISGVKGDEGVSS